MDIREASKYRRLQLISNQTESETIFKNRLLEIGIKFEFQKIIELKHTFYIVDFFIPSINTIVEIDGGYHFKKEQQIKDKEREQKLISKGYKIMRLKNNKVETIDIIKFLTNTKQSNKKKKIFKHKKERQSIDYNKKLKERIEANQKSYNKKFI